MKQGSTKNEDKKNQPTKAELEILQVLWESGPSTVRLVNEQLNEKQRNVNYTSTLKLMQIMAEKGSLVRDESQMKHVYRPAEDERVMKSHLLENFVNTLFNGSASSLLMQLLGNKSTSREELEAIRKMVEQFKK
jgi:BlaI family penicillinase repressor